VKNTEKAGAALISLCSTPTSAATGLVIAAENRGFCFRMALSSVEPERGNPEMKCIFLVIVLAIKD